MKTTKLNRVGFEEHKQSIKDWALVAFVGRYGTNTGFQAHWLKLEQAALQAFDKDDVIEVPAEALVIA